MPPAVTWLIPFVLAIVAIIVNNLDGYFPSLPDFPGRKWLMLRLAAWLALSAPLLSQMQTLKEAEKALPLWLKFGLVVSATLILYELLHLGGALWQVCQKGKIEKGSYRKRDSLIAFYEQVVKDRLKAALMTETFIDLNAAPQYKPVDELPPVKSNANKSLLQKALNLKLLFQKGEGKQEKIAQHEVIAQVLQGDIQRLLILGAPGAGKTTLLLALAQELLMQAQQPDSTIIPVILELSSWENKKLSMAEWIEFELDKLKIAPELTTQWLQSRQLFLLLDGLDELGKEGQKQVIPKINEFIRQNQYPQVVICCRYREFQETGLMLWSLDESVFLNPLSNEQIQQYLKSLGQRKLWEEIQASPELKQLLENPESLQERIGLRSPLLLTMLVVASQGGQSIQSTQSLFDAYVSQCFRLHQKSSKSLLYSEAETRHYLDWLGSKLDVSQRTLFFLEDLSPNWLDSLSQRLKFGLIGGLIYGLIYGLIVGLIYGLIVGLIGGLIYGLKKDEIENRFTPNQAILDSCKSFLLITFLTAPGGIALFTLPQFFSDQTVAWEQSPIFALGGAYCLVFWWRVYLSLNILPCGSFFIRLILFPRITVSFWNMRPIYAYSIAMPEAIDLPMTFCGKRYKSLRKCLKSRYFWQ